MAKNPQKAEQPLAAKPEIVFSTSAERQAKRNAAEQAQAIEQTRKQETQNRFESTLHERGAAIALGSEVERMGPLGAPEVWTVEGVNGDGEIELSQDGRRISYLPETLALEQLAVQPTEDGPSAYDEVEQRLQNMRETVKTATGENTDRFDARTLLSVAKELVRARALGEPFDLDRELLEALREDVTEGNLLPDEEELEVYDEKGKLIGGYRGDEIIPPNAFAKEEDAFFKSKPKTKTDKQQEPEGFFTKLRRSPIGKLLTGLVFFGFTSGPAGEKQDAPPKSEPMTQTAHFDLGTESIVGKSESAAKKKFDVNTFAKESKKTGADLERLNDDATIALAKATEIPSIEAEAQAIKATRRQNAQESIAADPTKREKFEKVNKAGLEMQRMLEKDALALAEVIDTPTTKREAEAAKASRTKRGRESIAASPEKQQLMDSLHASGEETRDLLQETSLQVANAIDTPTTQKERLAAKLDSWKRGNTLIESFSSWSGENATKELTKTDAEKFASNPEAFGQLVDGLTDLPKKSEFQSLPAEQRKAETAKAMRSIDKLEKAARDSGNPELDKKLEQAHAQWQKAYDQASAEIKAVIDARTAEEAEMAKIKADLENAE